MRRALLLRLNTHDIAPCYIERAHRQGLFDAGEHNVDLIDGEHAAHAMAPELRGHP
ncbi:MAG: hypothetical protein ACREYE_31990 [Gammaproteobacteria bacterium]